MTETAESLIAYCRENNRVCPKPRVWEQLWELLPDRRRIWVGWEPSLPLVFRAWHATADTPKMARLAEHIVWADRHDALADVAAFIRGLREADWHHVGE